MEKLTLPQKMALEKLTDEFQSVYQLGISRTVLNALDRKGYAVKKIERGAHFPGFENTSTYFKLKG